MKSTHRFPIVSTLIKDHPDAAVAALLLSTVSFSWLAWLYPMIEAPLLIILSILTFLLCAWNCWSGLLIVIGEVLMGSLGHAFVVDLHGYQCSLRIAMFAAALLGSFFWAVRQEKTGLLRGYTSSFLRDLPWLPAWIFVAVYGVVRALWMHQEFGRIVDDANQWAFLAIPILGILVMHHPVFQKLLSRMTRASFVVLSIVTLVILYIFTHDAVFQISLAVYRWARDTRMAEITLLSESFARVFLQSQIFLLIGWITLIYHLSFRRANGETGIRFCRRWRASSWTGSRHGLPRMRSQWLLLFLITSSLVMSFSRSFWVSMIIGWCLLVLPFLRARAYRQIGRAIRVAGSSIIGAAAIILVVAYVPIPHPGAFSVSGAFLDRTSMDESAVGSRWNLLPPLWHAVERHPLLGSGFGATVTYTSRDPRILEVNPTGQYTTHAFEWGALDFWYKFGILGLLLIGVLVWWLVQLWTKGYITSAISIAMLMATHFFTPYLNHPLGFTYMVLVSIATASGQDIAKFLFDTQTGAGV